jgi:asparagine N-glycosylation enzyme membrane subunit Stt3
LAESKDSSPRPLLSKLSRADRGASGFGNWLRANWAAVFMLVFIFFLALFIRSYFAYSTAFGNGDLVSGGSDSYYWQRIINYNANTGKNFYWDPLINFPDGIRNPRPPMYSFSVAVPSVLAEDLFSNLDSSMGFFLLWSTAIWGALTIFPVYLLGKETFGKRVGLVAAFLLAVMPSHVQRSVLSNADHDAFILFFITFTFYFLLKAVKAQQHRKWVESWKSMGGIWSGLKNYFANSRSAIIYSLLAGVCFGSVIITWVGFAYVAVLLLAYYVIQILVNKFRNVDSLSVTVLIFLAMGFGYLISFPVYYEQSLMSRFTVTFYLYLAAIVVGMLFVASRDLPWTIVLPAVGGVLILGVLVINAVYPALGEAILTGQGYFGSSKLYSTIAEVRAPRFSELAMSFGMVTFYMSLIGLIWALIKIPKRATSEYIFIVVWLAAVIFMAISAGRFMFNAAPAFAIAAGWVTVMIVDRLDFNSVRKSLSGASGSYLQVIKKSVKVRHVIGALFLAFLIVLPNVWYSFDAGIPSETKRTLDKQIYYSFPSAMRPTSYDKINGSDWYLGAFGYSLPLPSYYFPAAWSWFADQDSGVYPEAAKPAYVAWWDYGFEAVEAGKHPTVADNFQNGYQLTGNALMAQSEYDAIALFAYRLIQAGLGKSDSAEHSAIVALMNEYGVSYDRMEHILYGNAQDIISEVLSDNATYGSLSQDLSDVNARINAGRVELLKLGDDNLIGFYDGLCDVTGWSIRYFFVDSRMFPVSGSDTRIFYAPAKLSDRRLDNNSIPSDFYKVYAVDSSNQMHELDAVTSSMQITGYQISYQPMFYDSMFYRAYGGYSGSDLGLSNTALPGMSGALQNYPPMPGWNLTHFRVVYRTAYYNPYSSDNLLGHSDAWTAMEYLNAEALKKQINAKTIEGTVDDSAYSYYYDGCSFLEYYHGAYVNGTLTTEQGAPVQGVRVTIQDEYGIPHETTFTDADGHYSILAPFGNVTLSYSVGSMSNPTLIGGNVINQTKFHVTDAQAMRIRQDLNGDGIPDYIITKDFVMRGSPVAGDIFWDVNSDNNYTSGTDELIPNVTVYASDVRSGKVFRLNATEGSLDSYLPYGQYNFTAVALGANITFAEKVNVSAGGKLTQNLPITPAEILGNVTTPSGDSVAGLPLTLTDIISGHQFHTNTTSKGSYVFDRLLSSRYVMSTSDPAGVIFNQYFSADSSVPTSRDVVLYDKATLRYRVVDSSGASVPYAVFLVADNYDPTASVSGLADAWGVIDLELPVGTWSLYASYNNGQSDSAGLVLIDIQSPGAVTGTVRLETAYKLVGAMRNANGATLKEQYVWFESVTTGARIPMQTNKLGTFDTRFPAGTYKITSQDTVSKGVYSGTVVVNEDVVGLSLRMSDASVVSGTLWMNADSTGTLGPKDIGRLGEIKIIDSAGRVFTAKAATDGTFKIAIPKNSEVTLMLGNPGYRAWTQKVSYASDTSSVGIVAKPDQVVLTGKVTSASGSSLRGIQISLVPASISLPTVKVTTGAEGRYSVSVNPSNYTVSIDQAADSFGGIRYQYSALQIIEPSATAVTLNISPVLRANLFGTVLGASTSIQVKIVGLENKTLSPTTFNYSVFLLPGTYQVYSTGRVGSTQYASLALVEITATATEYNIQLERSYEVRGVATIGTSTVSKQVTVTARALDGASADTLSSRLGEYSMQLPPGTYVLSYVLEDQLVQGTQTLAVEYAAERIVDVVSAGQSVNPSLVIRMDNATFSGAVTTSDGAQVQAMIELKVNGKSGLDTTFFTSASGAFSAGIQSGDYTVYVTRLQDRWVALTSLHVSRNTPLERDIELVSGKYLTGQVTMSSAPSSEMVTVASGGASLKVSSDAYGAFSVLLPPDNYSLSGSTSKTENGLTIAYTLSKTVSVGANDMFVSCAFDRDTKRGVSASWSRNMTKSAGPNETITYTFTVTNTGNIADTFTCSYSGTGFTMAFTPSEVTLDFGSGQKSATVAVSITILDTQASGDTQAKVAIRSKTQTSTKYELSLYVNVLPARAVKVISLNQSETVSSQSSYTAFTLNNTGNTWDSFVVEVANLPSLAELGWTAIIVDPDTGEQVYTVTLDAYQGKDLKVKFTATRVEPNPAATASVYAYSSTTPSVSTYGGVTVMLPDLVVGPGDLQVTRSDIAYSIDPMRAVVNVALVAALGGLVLTFVILRRMKGLSGGGKK